MQNPKRMEEEGGGRRHGKGELKKGPWTREEDQKLLDYIRQHGHGSWRSLPAKAGLERCGKSCRLRWANYLRPDIKRGKFSPHEEKTIIRLHALLGNRWSAIAAHLPKRTDNELKNYWNTRLKKRLARMGIDPATHRPKIGAAQSRLAAEVSHMAQWEAARLEAEARLARESSAVHLSGLHLLRAATRRPQPLPPPRLAVLPCLDVLKVWQANGGGGGGGPFGSPTSTLNFCRTTAGAETGNDVVSVAGDAEPQDGIENSLQMDGGDLGSQTAVEVDGCELASSADLAQGYDVDGSAIFGEFEDTWNYWNDLLNLVDILGK